MSPKDDSWLKIMHPKVVMLLIVIVICLRQVLPHNYMEEKFFFIFNYSIYIYL